MAYTYSMAECEQRTEDKKKQVKKETEEKCDKLSLLETYYRSLSLKDEMNEGRSLKTKYLTGIADGIEIAMKVFQDKYNINEEKTKEYIDEIRKELFGDAEMEP